MQPKKIRGSAFEEQKSYIKDLHVFNCSIYAMQRILEWTSKRYLKYQANVVRLLKCYAHK